LKTLVISLDDLEKDPSVQSNVFLQVAKIVNKGGVIVFPTDTVYGIGGNPLDVTTIQKILKIKDRLSEKGLPILVNRIDSITDYAYLSPPVKKILNQAWPGPFTFILPKTPLSPENLSQITLSY
jgi:L-threonylcarbamoyladenylate synthase